MPDNKVDFSLIHNETIEAMKMQMLIVLVNRLGGSVDIPVAEIDGTGRYNLAFKIDPTTRVFTFEVRDKQ